MFRASWQLNTHLHNMHLKKSTIELQGIATEYTGTRAEDQMSVAVLTYP